MATSTISGFTTGSAGNATGAAYALIDDSTGTTVKYSLATLRTKMFAGGSGYTATDPLTCGALSATSGTFSSTVFPPALSSSPIVAIDNSGAGVVLADGATLAFGVNAFNYGEFYLTDTVASHAAKFGIVGGTTVWIISQDGTLFTTTLNNAGTINVYFSGSQVTIQNKKGSSATLRGIPMRA